MIAPSSLARFARAAFLFAATLVASGPRSGEAQDLQPIPIATIERETPVDFGKEIQPLLAKHCTACHNQTVKEGGLVLEDPKQMIKGGHEGPAVVPGKSDESLLLKLASHQAEPAMPPPDNDAKAEPLTSDELGLIKLWIDQGAAGEGVKTKDVVQWQPLPAGVQPIYAAAVTSDGQFAACARANQIFIYQLPSGKLLTRLTDPNLLKSGVYKKPGVADLDIVQSLAFNPEGDLLASGGFRTVKLWRRPQNVRPFEFAVGSGPASAVATTNDGRLAAIAASDGTIKLFDLASGQPAASFAGHSAPATSLVFSADGAKLFSSSTDQTVRVWSTADGKQLARFDAPTAVHAITLVGDQQTQLATAEASGDVRLWDLTAPPTTAYKNDGPAVVAQALSEDRKTLAQINAEGAIRTLDLADPKAEWKTVGKHAGAKSLSFANYSPRLASAGSDDGIARVWDLSKNQLLVAVQTQPTSPATAVALNHGGSHLIVGSGDGKLASLKLEQPAPRVIAADAGVVPNVFAVSDDGRRLAVATTVDGKPGVVVREIASGQVLKSLVGPDAPVTCLSLGRDGARLAAGSADKTARVWDVVAGNQISLFAAHGQPLVSIALSADGQKVASAGADHSVRVWNAADAAELKALSGHGDKVTGLAFVANDSQLVTASVDQNVRVFNLADGAQARAIPLGAAIESLAASHDRNTLAAALRDHSIKLVRLGDGSVAQTLVGHQQPVGSLAFSPDDQRLISGAGDSRAIVWEVASGKPLETLPVAAGVALAAWTSEAQQALVGANDRSIVATPIHFERSYENLPKGAVGIVFHPGDGNRFFVAAADGTLRSHRIDAPQANWNASHAAPIVGFNISRDGRWIATGGENKQLRVWNSDNGGGAPKPSFDDLPDVVRAAAFSNDGKRVVAGCGPQAIVFNLESGLVEQRFAQHGGPVLALATAAEPGQRFASASADGAQVWSLGHVRAMKQKHQGPATSLATVPTNKSQIVSGGADGNVRCHDVNSGDSFRNFSLGGPVAAVDVRLDGQRIAAAGEGKVARLWNFQNSQQVAELKGDARAIARAAAVAKDVATAKADLAAAQQQVAAAEKDAPAKAEAATKAKETLATADKTLVEKTAADEKAQGEKAAADKLVAETAAALKTAEAAQKSTDEAAKKAEGEAKASASQAEAAAKASAAKADDAALAEAKAAAEKTAAEKKTAFEQAQAAKEAAEKALAESKAKAKEATEKLTAATKPAEEAAKALAAARTAKEQAEKALRDAESDAQRATQALAAAKAKTAEAEARQKKSEEELVAANAAAAALETPLRALAFSPDGSQLVVAGDGKTLNAYDSETGKAQGVFEGHAAGVSAVRYTPDGDGFVSAAADGQAYVWDQNPDWKLERQIGDVEDGSKLSHRVLAVAFSPDGKLVASGSGDPSRSGELKVWNVADGSLAREFVDAHSDTVFGVAFSPDGKRLASGAADKFLKVFDLGNGELVRSFEGHTHHVLSVSWHWRGQLLATAGADNVAKVWDMETGEQTRTVQGYPKQVTSIEFVGETDDFVSSCGDGTVRIHKATNGQSVRNFSGASDFMNAARATPDGLLVLGGGQDGVLRVWNGQNGQSIKALEAPAATQDAVAEKK